MAAVEEIRAQEQLASVAAKLDVERKANKSLSDEINALRNKVVKLEDASVTEELQKVNDELAGDVDLLEQKLKAVTAERDKALRDLAAAGPALALADAIKAI